MDIELINRLNQLNTEFYKTTAASFDQSRQYFWEGWEKIPPLLDVFQNIRVADIGCGNGRFGQFLYKKKPQLKISYTGIDSNEQLLAMAKENLQGKIPALHLQQTDLITAIINAKDFLPNQEFQLITSFGVLHHIPSYELRLALVKFLLSKLEVNGYLIISFWQFMQFERFRKKIVTDQRMLTQKKISLIQLEANDYILDWKRGEFALRYCHYVDENEQKKLIQESGAQLITEYTNDGKEGIVNKYIILSK